MQINWKIYKILDIFVGGVTNKVFLAEDEQWTKVVIKKSEKDDLKREIDFFWFVSKNNIDGYPKLLDVWNFDKTIVLEYKKWVNWQDIDILSENWTVLWEEFWVCLKKLHIEQDLDEQQKNIAIYNIISYFFIWDLKFFEKEFELEKEILKKMMKESNEKFVMNHGDFSPHNCLFVKKKDKKYHLSTILDPSWRAWYGFKYFDIVYLFNTRHIKYKTNLKKWFLKSYTFDKEKKLYKQFDKVMKMYLIELYYLMWFENESLKLLKSFSK